MSDTAYWLDYEFEVNTPDVFWHAVPGLYIFAGLDSDGEWIPFYIGSAKSLVERLPYHPRWLEATLFGATHIHARVEWHKGLRENQEKRFIRFYQPCLNIQHRNMIYPLLDWDFFPARYNPFN